jgi:hypothetical protein
VVSTHAASGAQNMAVMIARNVELGVEVWRSSDLGAPEYRLVIDRNADLPVQEMIWLVGQETNP